MAAQPGEPVVAAQPDEPVVAAQPDKPVMAAQPGELVVAAQPGEPVVVAQPGEPVVAAQPGERLANRTNKVLGVGGLDRRSFICINVSAAILHSNDFNSQKNIALQR